MSRASVLSDLSIQDSNHGFKAVGYFRDVFRFLATYVTLSPTGIVANPDLTAEHGEKWAVCRLF
jgi:hypothetical protein